MKKTAQAKGELASAFEEDRRERLRRAIFERETDRLMIRRYQIPGIDLVSVGEFERTAMWSINSIDEKQLLKVAPALCSAFCNQWVVLACCMLFGDLRKPGEWMR